MPQATPGLPSIRDVLAEFVLDVEAVYGAEGAVEGLEEEGWGDLAVTYLRAKAALERDAV
jgi:hypothetical protein